MSDQNFTYRRAACLSNGIYKIPNLQHFSRAASHYSTYGINADRQFKSADLLIDWGNKRFEITSRLSARDGVAVLSLEDGFIRSMGLGVNGSRSFSLVSDWSGIYYDARRPSDLENILLGSDPRSAQIDQHRDRARTCIKRITEQGISKYNHAPDLVLPASDRKRILLVDQTAGDLSISSGLASARSFEKMLEDAIAESDADILIKIHPDVIAGKKQGYLGKRDYPAHIQILSDESNPVNLLKQVDEVRVVTSQMGFEACLLGLPVRCYGMPFYAGWGITEDTVSCSRRTQKRSLEQVFTAAYLLYTTYFDPETAEVTELETLLDHIERQKYYWQKNQGQYICLGFDRWKHSYVKNYLRSNDNHIRFEKHLRPQHIQADTKVLVWGTNISAKSKQLAEQRSLPLITMEDGFIRSINLGKYGTEPRSLVVDQGGIYFDPELPSDLEQILQCTHFSDAELQTAKRVRTALTTEKISKYNIGQREALAINARPDQQILLVPGQVGIDASIARGCDHIKTNIELLKLVREQNPQAYIIFKPHPDVVSGNIVEASITLAETPGTYETYANQIESTASIHSCMEVAHEVHTMTSLVGFEALLLGKTVHCYGRPFYSGWGLTQDKSQKSTPRRTRKLVLDELVAGVLIRYPRYVCPLTGEFTTAERTLKSLGAELQARGAAQLHSSRLARWLLKIRYGGLGIMLSWFR